MSLGPLCRLQGLWRLYTEQLVLVCLNLVSFPIAEPLKSEPFSISTSQKKPVEQTHQNPTRAYIKALRKTVRSWYYNDT